MSACYITFQYYVIVYAQNKCRQYWPKEAECEVIFDEFRIEMQSTLSSTKDYVIAKLILEREGETVKPMSK